MDAKKNEAQEIQKAERRGGVNMWIPAALEKAGYWQFYIHFH